MSQPKTPEQLNAEFVRIAADLGNSIAEAVVNAAASALQTERAAVVTWLREVAETMNHNGDKCCGRVADLASAVERGEHRREEKTP